ncbi:MAG: DUF2281 domain-containing protein [Chloroflexaceae bacterium]|nr:DUF2281 domain-containing protein [Chloroflexaceae bacterium]
MMLSTKSFEELVQELPPEAQIQARHFVEGLLAKHRLKSGRKLRQDWAGTLQEYRHQYTSLELQRKALEWRTG